MSSTQTPFAGTIRPVAPSDIEAVRSVVQTWITEPEDIGHTITAVEQSLAASATTYLVAESPAGEVVGVMGITAKNIDDSLYGTTDNPVEIISAYVRPDQKGTGAGRALADKLEEIAQAKGYTKLIIVSGSRNRESGYPFWHKRYGTPSRFDADYFGKGQERVAWTKEL